VVYNHFGGSAMAEDVLRVLVDVTQRQIDAIRDNTEALNKIEAEARIQTHQLQLQQKSLDELKKLFTNGFKTEVLKSIDENGDKMDSIDKDLKVQWAIIGGGFLGVIATIVVAALQIAKG
jgi:hypothetical protein